MQKREIKNCPPFGGKAYITNGLMGNITMFVCGNYRNCGATVSFDNPLANNKPELTTMFWNNRKEQK